MKIFCTSKKIILLLRKTFLILGLFCLVHGKIDAQTYVNGNLSTGPAASSGETAPAGTNWSEVQTGNNNAGYNASVTDGFSLADDFTIAAGTWSLNKFTCYAYSTGYAGTVSPFTDLRLQIFDTDPSVGAPAPIYGDLTTNVLSASSDVSLYRIFTAAAATDRIIWKIEANIAVELSAGHYWVEWQVGTALTSNWCPASTVVGTVTQPGNNAMQHTLAADTWTLVLDGLTGTDPQDMPFIIDYTTPPCTGTPAPGATISTVTETCSSNSFTLTPEVATAGSGITYQWQSSATGVVGTFTDIPGATNYSLTTTQSAANYYQLVVTCSGNAGTTTPVLVGLTPPGQCYCIPIPTDCTDGDIITNVTIGALNNTSDCGTDGFTDYTIDPTIIIPDLIQGVDNPISVTAGGGIFQETVAAWIDYDHNGSFDPSEFTFIGSTLGGTLNANIHVPGAGLSTLGATRMRVRVSFLVLDPLGDGDACLLYTYGETEDYSVNIITCTEASIITSPLPAAAVCGKDTSFQVTATGSGNIYQWQYRTNTAAPWTNVVDGIDFGGATTTLLHVYRVNQSMNGYEFRAIATAGCGGGAESDSATLTVNPIVVDVTPAAINVCLPSGLVPISITTLNTINATQTVAFSSGTINLIVPDLDGDPTGVTNTITVPTLPVGAVITGASVKLNINHTYIGDLIIALKAPNGNVLNLDYILNGTGGPGPTTGFVNTEIGSAGTTTLDLGSDPWTGLFAPDAYPAPIAGIPTAPTSLSPTDANVFTFPDLYSVPSGNWTIGLYDYAMPDEGTVVDWTLKLTYTINSNEPYNGTWSPVTDLYNDAAGTSPYVAGSAQSTVYLQPTITTTYTVTPVTTNCTGTPVSIPVTVSTPLGTLTQPVDASICENNTTSFTVSTSAGSPVIYQWQVSTDGGINYNGVADGGVYSGAATTTLTLTNVPLAYNGYKYKAVLTVAACSNTAISNPATLTVTPGGATITSQPVNSVVCEGENNTFSVIATGADIIYQWQVSTTGCTGVFTDIPGANANNYTIVGVTSAQNNYAYVCVITGTCSPLISNCATLTVNTAVTILVQPSDVSTCEGGTATFTSSGSGSVINYQWQVNSGSGWSDLPGETNPTLTIPAVTSGLSGNQYQVIISNTDCPGAVTSTPATLTVTTAPVISIQPTDVVTCNGSDAVFTVSSSGTNVLYQWQINTGVGWTDIPGATSAVLTLPGVTSIINGAQYHVILTIIGCTGTTVSVDVTLTVNESPVITIQPSSTTACEGNVVTFNSDATGTGLIFQWQVSIGAGPFTDIPGATSQIYITPPVTAPDNNNQYNVVITGACPPAVTSTAATLTVNTAPVFTSQPVSASTCINGSATFTIVVAGGGTFSYQWEVSNVGCGGPWANLPVASSPILVVTNVGATAYYRCRITGSCLVGSIYSDCATLTVSGAIDITTQPVDQTVCNGTDALFTVASGTAGVNYQWQVSVAAGPFSDIPGETNATLTMPAVTAALSGNQYQVVLTNPGCPDPTTSNIVTLTVNESPAITTQPADATVCEGDVATFNSNATGTNINYQWQVSTDNGTTYSDITGANASVYITTPVTLAMNGHLYQVIVTGTCSPAVTSTAALLTVNVTAVITTQPADVSSCAGTDVTFTVAAIGAGLTYQWQVSAGGCGLTPFVDLPGETNAGLTLTGITAGQNTNAYHCVVTGTCGGVIISNCGLLNVGTLDITTQPADQAVCAGSAATFTSATNGTGVTYQWQVSIASGPFTDITGATTSTLLIPAATVTGNGNQYVVVVSNSLCPTVISTPATLTVTGPVNITTQPVDFAACENSDATFTVATDGSAGTLIEWQGSTDGGATFTDIPGATNTVLTLTAVTSSMNGYIYHAVVTNPICASVVTSINVTLTVNPLPAITAATDATEVCTGTDVHLTATGAGAGTYTWNPGGLNGAAVTIQPAVDPGTPGSPNPIVYTVTGLDGNGCTGTATVTVIANPLPVVTITANPANTSLLPGQSTILTATVTPSGTYDYSWTKDGTTVAGAATSSLTVSSGEAGLYAATASGTGGICAATSNTIQVSDSVITKFNIYANPNNGQFTVVYPNLPAGSSVGVFDGHGSRVSVKANIDANQAIHVDMRPMASGVYIVVVYNGAGERLATGRVIVVE